MSKNSKALDNFHFVPCKCALVVRIWPDLTRCRCVQFLFHRARGVGMDSFYTNDQQLALQPQRSVMLVSWGNFAVSRSVQIPHLDTHCAFPWSSALRRSSFQDNMSFSLSTFLLLCHMAPQMQSKPMIDRQSLS